MKIFLVEDNPGDVVLTREALKEIIGPTFQMEVATDGAALSQIDLISEGKSQIPDVFFIDINLPKRNGKEVFEHLRKKTVTQKSPVILISTSGRYEDRHFINDENKPGIYIEKPMNFADFVHALRGALQKLEFNTTMLSSLIM
ncbi:MAG: response regulator [Bacteroidia bacterium]